MHGEAADKPRYSFNFRIGLGEKKEKGKKRREGKKWKRRAHKKGKCSAERGGRRGGWSSLELRLMSAQ